MPIAVGERAAPESGAPEKWWIRRPEEVEKILGARMEKGLSLDEAGARLLRYGPNRLPEATGPSAFRIFLGQFHDLMIWVLISAALLSGLLKEWTDAVAIIAIVVLNAVLGFIQEYKAETSLAALRKLSSPASRVIRDGRRQTIPSDGLVPGDLVELESGDHVPADGRIVWTANFATQEAALTGESTSVEKFPATLAREELALGDRKNMAYLGTSVATGKARLIVTGTGVNTELGKIARLMQSIGTEATPLQKRLEALGRWLIYFCLAIVGVVFVTGLARGGSFVELFLTAVSLAVAAIPEGLPAVVTIALAIGVQRMVKRHALIRKLPAVETLGSTGVICTDKTGTLTQNKMMVRAIWAGGDTFEVDGAGYSPEGEIRSEEGPLAPDSIPEALSLTLEAGVLCNGAELAQKEGLWTVVGDPTEGALLASAARAGLGKERLERREPVETEIPFDSDRKLMTVIRKTARGWRAYVKGAPDVVLARSRAFQSDGNAALLTDDVRREIAEANETLAGKGLRVLALAYRDLEALPGQITSQDIEKDLVLAGLQAMQDPPRPEVPDAVKTCLEAGIRPVMITGDHPQTARAIAREVGILDGKGDVLTGIDLDRLSDAELAERVSQVPVYARVSAEHKLRIVRAWRSKGAVVAMTGDGVNDAPALKEADIGVAMGITGTDVTKEAADMVVLDDNFASIVSAVEEGRSIYQNIRRFVYYLLSCNAGEVLVMFAASLIGWPLPLLPIQILWVNLVTDGLPALALGVEPSERGLMRRPVRPREEGIVNRAFVRDVLGAGTLIAFASLAAFSVVFFIEGEDIEHARTAALMVLATSQLVHAFNCRSERESLFRIGVLSNPKLVGAVALSFVLQLAVIYWPPAQAVFKTVDLRPFDLAMTAGLSLIPLVVVELMKAWRRRKRDAEPRGVLP